MALETRQDQSTMAELASRFEVHPNLIAQGKRQVSEGPVKVFGAKASRRSSALLGPGPPVVDRKGIGAWIAYHHQRRPHFNLDGQTPDEAY